MVAQRGVPLLPLVVVVALLFVVAVGAAETAGFTVKINAPSSGSPSSAETVIQRTTYTPLPVGLIPTDISLGLESETFASPWLIKSPAGP